MEFCDSRLRRDNGIGDQGLLVGYAENLPARKSLYNWPHPPMVVEKSVAVSFQEDGEELMRAIHPTPIDGDQWPMVVRTGDKGAMVGLTFEELSAVNNPEWSVMLFDIDQRLAYDLRQQRSLDINSGSGLRHFRIVVGTRAFVEENSSGIELYPKAFALLQNYPNPFNAATVIQYHLPFTIHYSLRVYDLLGREVAVLVDEERAAGTHTATWDASRMPSGVYFYRLRVGGFSETKRLLLLK